MLLKNQFGQPSLVAYAEMKEGKISPDKNAYKQLQTSLPY